MNKLLILVVFSCNSLTCLGQKNLKKDSNPFVLVNLGLGTSESYAGLSIPLGNNQFFLSVNYLQSFSTNDSCINRPSQWYGIENNIRLNNKTELIVGLGYLTDIERGFAFDVSPKVGLQMKLAGNLSVGVSYVQFIPRNIKTSYKPLLALDLKYMLRNQKNFKGIVKRKGQNPEIFASATFGSHYSSLGLDAYSRNYDALGLSVRIYTSFGTLFETGNAPEWQMLSLNYRYLISKEIEIASLLGVARELKPTLAAFSPLIGFNLRTLIYENIYFTMETSLTAKKLVRERRQPIVHAGLSVLL